jgi:hypothetical protein
MLKTRKIRGSNQGRFEKFFYPINQIYKQINILLLKTYQLAIFFLVLQDCDKNSN